MAEVRPRRRCDGVGTRSTGGSGDGATGRDAETHFQSFGDGKPEEGLKKQLAEESGEKASRGAEAGRGFGR